MNQAYQQPQTGAYSADRTLELVNAFMRRVYNWMALGLGLTAAAAYVVTSNDAIKAYFINPGPPQSPTMAWWVVLFATFGLAMGISFGIRRLQAGTAATLFIVYGALMGIFIAPVLMAYTEASVYKTFLITAGTFWHNQHLGLHHQEGFVRLGLLPVHGPYRHNPGLDSEHLSSALRNC
jgi:FtsH-binding integral membrane protein